MKALSLGVCLAALVALSAGTATFYTPIIELPRKRTAVVLGSGVGKQAYSKFLGVLEGFGSVDVVDAKKLKLKIYEEFQYDNLVVLGNAGKIDADLVDFVDQGNNVMIVAGSEGAAPEEYLSDDLRSVAVEFGAEFTMNPVADPFNKAGSDIIVSDNYVKSKPLVGTGKLPPVKFAGLGIRVEEFNPLVIQVLSATSTSFVSDPEVLGAMYGTNIALVSAIQTRVGSRAVLVGGTSLLKDANWKDNGAFVAKLSAWNQQRTGVVRYSDIDYVKLTADGQENRDGDMFPIRQHVRFSMTLEEYDGEKGEWVAFETPAEDPVQLEWTMMDPYVRADLKRVGRTHTADIQAPDQYGVFKFVIDHRRVGYNPLVVHHECPIRPMRMNEHERFIFAAYPYYLGTFSAMAGFIFLGFAYLPLLSNKKSA